MPDTRLKLALDGGVISVPEAGRIAVFGPRMGMDLDALPRERLHVLTGFKPDHDYFAGLGFDCAVMPEGRYTAAVVILPRSKSLAQAMLAEAAGVTDGDVIVDGLKTDGVESVLRDLRKRGVVSAPLSKAHGKIFSFRAAAALDDWHRAPRQIDGGFQTRPGVFSADGIDPGSAFLAAHLPARLGAEVADLGGGWGYLSHAVLKRDDVRLLHLVEADHAALDCARRNLKDARTRFHWADATHWQSPAPLDCVVMNPPFHIGRAADPALGRAFIQAAAAILKPGGQLWLVANRHLPYDTALEAAFVQAEEVVGDGRFKILRGARPKRKRP